MGAGGPKDSKCGKGVRGARREEHKRSRGENQIWWRASPQGTKHTSPRHASTSLYVFVLLLQEIAKISISLYSTY
eukprot:2470843-Pleurochrysis_carterae.AAC.3